MEREREKAEREREKAKRELEYNSYPKDLRRWQGMNVSIQSIRLAVKVVYHRTFGSTGNQKHNLGHIGNVDDHAAMLRKVNYTN